MPLILRKSLTGLAYVFAVTVLVFALSAQMPGDPAYILAKGERELYEPTPEEIERTRREYGLDKGWAERYAIWLYKLVTEGDLGISLRTKTPVIKEIKTFLPATVELAGLVTVVTASLALSLGLVAGLTENGMLKALIRTMAWVGFSFPVFLLGTLAIWLFAVEFGVLPSMGRGELRHAVLPVAVLAIHLAGSLTQIIYASVSEVKNKGWVLYARAKGIGGTGLVHHHILRPAILPIFTVLVLQFGRLLGGSLVIETLFAWPGLGSLMITSIKARDVPAIQGLILLIGITSSVINTVIDVAYGYLDPRVTAKAAGR